MEKRLLLISLCLQLLFTSLFAQVDYRKTSEYLNANNFWPIAQNRAINFFKGTATLESSKLAEDTQDHLEASASVSHPLSGKLLFYMNNKQIYNAEHQPMLNGANNFTHPSCNNGVIIAPFVGDSNLYYIFHYNNPLNYGSNEILYSVVDMRLDNGKGGLVDTLKNVFIDGDSFYVKEGLNVIAGNNCDIWLIANSSSYINNIEGNQLRAYHITENGINTNPVISKCEGLGGMTRLSSSSDNKLFVNAPYWGIGVEVLAFNSNTGMFNSKYLLPFWFGFRDGTFKSDFILDAFFSPDNSKLYLSQVDMLVNKNYLLQFDLKSDHIDSIINSKSQISLEQPTRFRLYNDTLYLHNLMMSNKNVTLEVDRYSNLNGTLSQLIREKAFIQTSDTLKSLHFGAEVMFPATYLSNLIVTQFCTDQELLVTASSDDAVYYLWNDGSSARSKSITQSGTYWVQHKTYKSTHCFETVTDTFNVTLYPTLEEPIISVNENELSTQKQDKVLYQWLLNDQDIPGATDNKYVVKENGNYQVRITSLEGCIKMSQVYKVANHTGTGPVVRESIKVYPNPTTGLIFIESQDAVQVQLIDVMGRALLSGKSKTVDLSSLASGIYELSVYNNEYQLMYRCRINKQ